MQPDRCKCGTDAFGGCQIHNAARCRYLEGEIERLQGELGIARSFFEVIQRNDKTVYDYRGTVAKNRNGSLPPEGKRWDTPRETAKAALAVLAMEARRVAA